METNNNTTVTPTQLASEYQTSIEEKIRSTANKLKNLLPTLIAGAIAIWWIFGGIVDITPTIESKEVQVTLAILSIIFGFSYRTLLGNGGFDSAKQSQTWISVTNDWNAAIMNGLRYQSEIKLYAEDVARDNRRNLRRENLESNEMLYENFFDKEGNLINADYQKQKNLTRHQKSIVKKCVEIKIVIPTLFGNVSDKFFGLKKQLSQADYQGKKAIKNLIITIVISFVSAGIVFTYKGFTIESILYSAFQIILWSATAMTERISNYNFVIEKIAPQIVEKVIIINGFLSLSDSEKAVYTKRVEDMRHDTLAYKLDEKAQNQEKEIKPEQEENKTEGEKNNGNYTIKIAR